MALVSLVTFDLTGTGDAKSLRRRSIGSYFWHLIAPLCFFLSLTLALDLFRRQQHRHIAPFQARLDIDFGDVLHQANHPREHLPA